MSAKSTKVPTPSTSNDERQPLLQPSDAVVDVPADEGRRQEFGEPETGKIDDLTWRGYAFYGASFIIGLLALGFLIKGFIDSGDKDVSNGFPYNIVI